MGKQLFILLGFLAIISGCGKPRLALIPEISPPLIQEEVFTWTGQMAGNLLFPCAEGIGWVDASGQIVTWNPEKKVAGKIFRLPFAASDPPFRQGDFLVLKSQKDDQLLVFDLFRMKTNFVLKDLQVKQILAVNGDCLVYLDGGNLVVYSRENPTGIFRWPNTENEFFNCHFFPDRILIMSSRQLFIFWKKSGKFQLMSLPLAAATEFICQGEYVFYGSKQRQLVKYSLRKNQTVWKLKLGQNMKRQPLAFKGTIIVNPEDNNVLQLNKSGSVRWWLALDSIPQFNLLSMADHLAVFLLKNEIKFINLRSLRITGFKINGYPAGLPLVYNHDLYFILTDGETQKLQRVGNLYGINVTLAPDKTQLLGTSIVFSIQTSNLLEPSLHCVIRDEAGQTVLAKDFDMADRATLAWIPSQAGIYRMQVRANALNHNEEKEISFQVFDLQNFIQRYYFHFLFGIEE